MNFNKHSNLEGSHAFLSASKYSWLNYDEEQLYDAYLRFVAIQKGTELHDLAKRLIKLGVRLPGKHETLNLYVNDAIGYKMTPEQPLFYSINSYGTADAICFRKNLLRIHDLKTGQTPAKMRQLEIYSALFCLEYNMKPDEIKTELRIYQNDEVLVHHPEPEAISDIMDQTVIFDKRIEQLREENI